VLVFLSLSPLIICQPNFSLDDIASKKKEDLLCSICVDIVADLDKWLTSEATEDQIVEWMYRICETLGDLISPDLVQVCEVVLGAQLPSIIDNLVNNNLNPEEVCKNIGACVGH